jgi:phosphatidylethanolamine/phosphatidyl-N-methylethanolamine N-methyltransferase
MPMRASQQTLVPKMDLTARPTAQPLTRLAVLSAYRRMAPVYDWVFGACFAQGRRNVIATLSRVPGRRVLEVGVGTGLSLRHWPRNFEITGIDLSPDMLRRAELARRRHRLHNVTLQLMDAQAMEFPDDSFDKVAAMYVVSVVPDLHALLREMRRVCRPGGRICIVNHFEHRNGLVRRFERKLSRHASFLGFDAALPLRRVTETDGLRILDVRPANWGDYWSLIEAENVK